MIAPILPTPIYWVDRDCVILGANELVLKAIGIKNENYFGKSVYDIYPYKMADHIKKHNDKVIESGKILSQEEMIETVDTKEIKYYIAVKAPLRDDDGNIIGVVGTSIDITAEKEIERLKKRTKILEYLDMVASNLPTPMAWLDINSVVLGINDQGAKAIGVSRENYIGKTAYEIYPRRIADHIKRHDEEVIRRGIPLSQEESIIDATTGQLNTLMLLKHLCVMMMEKSLD